MPPQRRTSPHTTHTIVLQSRRSGASVQRNIGLDQGYSGRARGSPPAPPPPVARGPTRMMPRASPTWQPEPYTQKVREGDLLARFGIDSVPGRMVARVLVWLIMFQPVYVAFGMELEEEPAPATVDELLTEEEEEAPDTPTAEAEPAPREVDEAPAQEVVVPVPDEDEVFDVETTSNDDDTDVEPTSNDSDEQDNETEADTDENTEESTIDDDEADETTGDDESSTEDEDAVSDEDATDDDSGQHDEDTTSDEDQTDEETSDDDADTTSGGGGGGSSGSDDDDAEDTNPDEDGDAGDNAEGDGGDEAADEETTEDTGDADATDEEDTTDGQGDANDETEDVDVSDTETASGSDETLEETTEENVTVSQNLTNKYTFGEGDCTVVADGEFYCIASGPERQATGDPRVYAEKDREGDTEIFYFDGVEVKRITNNGYDDFAPVFDEDTRRIVWQAMINDRLQVMFHELPTNTTRQVTTSRSNSSNPDIEGDTVVWQEWVETNWEVMMTDIDNNGEPFEIERLTDNAVHDMFPQVYDDLITWQHEKGSSWEVIVYDMRTGKEHALEKSEDTKFENPRFVLLFDSRHDNGDVETIGYDLDTGEMMELGTRSTPIPSQPVTPREETPEALPREASSSSQVKVQGREDDADTSDELL